MYYQKDNMAENKGERALAVEKQLAQMANEYIINAVDGILKRLHTDYLDILLLHRPDALVEPEEVAKAFDELKNKNVIYSC